MKKVDLARLIVFLAAFLLFQIELIIAKVLLPEFGGGYAVWGAAIVFFQATLLLGYLYSHAVIKRIGIFKYRYFHLALMAVTLLFFPGRSLPSMLAIPHIPMTISIFLQLAATIGVSFFFLSTVSIVFQSWLASSELEERHSAYHLYGISNLGSFAALLTYPFLFEYIFGINAQLNVWRLLYILLLALNAAAFGIIKVSAAKEEADAPAARIKVQDYVRWLLLGAAGVVMFLAVTNVITYELVPMPLLWILPLSIYLLSFALNFRKDPKCPAWVTKNIHIILALSTIAYFLAEAKIVDFVIMMIVYLSALFAICMFCQNALYTSRPEGKKDITIFYLVFSTGGFLGGLFTSWVAPVLFSSPVEYLLGILCVAAVLAMNWKKPLFTARDGLLMAGLLAVMIIWPVIFRRYNVFGVVALGWISCAVYAGFRERPAMFAVGTLLMFLMAASPISDILWSRQLIVHRHRDYYGIYKVTQAQEKRYLVNGNTMHGAQYTIKEREAEPLMYYHRSTPMGMLLMSPSFDFKHIGMIGLGTGAVAAYGKPGQTIDFFELDPYVLKIANKYFTYLKNCAAKTNFTIGDARITIKNAPKNYFDVLFVDAFSGDYIPAHLITLEAISEYRRHMAEKGVIMFHTSNRYLNLEPVLFAAAGKVGAYACTGRNRMSFDASASVWIAFTWDKGVFDKMVSELKWRPDRDNAYKRFRVWTDTYTNVMRVLRTGYILDQIKTFQPFYWSFDLLSGRKGNLYYYTIQGGRSLLESDFNQSVSYYQKALELDPNNANLMRSLGNVYYLSGQYQQAADSYKRAIKVNQKDAVAYRNLGSVSTRLGLYTDAEMNYKKAIQIDPSDAESFLGLGGVYNMMGKYNEAAIFYGKAAELKPASTGLATTYKIQQDVLKYQKAVEANQSDTAALLNLGDAYMSLRQYKQAGDAYQKIIAIRPDDALALEREGDAFYRQLDYLRADEYYRKAVLLKPQDSASLLQKLGNVSTKLGKYTEAMQYYEKLSVVNPDNPITYIGMSIAQVGQKEFGKARENIIKAKKLFEEKNDLKNVRMLDNLLKKIGADTAGKTDAK
jgi:tetratricopeptide (TPR) repeat protein